MDVLELDVRCLLLPPDDLHGDVEPLAGRRHHHRRPAGMCNCGVYKVKFKRTDLLTFFRDFIHRFFITTVLPRLLLSSLSFTRATCQSRDLSIRNDSGSLIY